MKNNLKTIGLGLKWWSASLASLKPCIQFSALPQNKNKYKQKNSPVLPISL
jgi:hypothetical protein